MKKEDTERPQTAHIAACSQSRWFARPSDAKTEGRSSDYFLWSEELEDQVRVTPDSPEWFDWLAGLSCFEFEGNQGAFLAEKQTAKGADQPAHWIASQEWPEKEYRRNLGETAKLTTSYLEEVAAELEAEVATHEIGGTGEGDLCYLFVPSWKEKERWWSSITYRCLFAHQQ